MGSRAPWLRILVGGIGIALTASEHAGAFQFPGGKPSDTFEATVFVEGLTQPTDFRLLPDGRAVVTERVGDVVVLSPEQAEVRTHINVLAAHGEQGLLGVVAHPDFRSNHYLYFYASAAEDVENRHQVIRYTLGDDGKIFEPKIIVNEGLRGPANHNGGALEFYGDALYVSVGDTGQATTPPVNKFATCLNVANGKILRVDPESGEAFPGNPLENEEMVTGCDERNGELGLRPPDKRIFAWGLRNPFRFWIDPQSGLMWIGDVGEKAKEEISVGGGGRHYGWPFFEGTVEYAQPWKPANTCNGIVPPTDCVPPALEYNHAATGAAVIGGLILDGCGWPESWRKRYIFGDPNKGLIYTAQVNDTRDGMIKGTIATFGSIQGLSAIRFGHDNAFYLVEYTAGRVTRLTAKGAPTTCVRGVDGESCEAAADCASNRCVDGVCCNSDCAGSCEACNEALTGLRNGTCAPIVAGDDPEDECEVSEDSSDVCGADGTCDGAGACRDFAPAETPCGTVCSEDWVLVSGCDGEGTCVSGEPRSCEPYICRGDACLTECESAADCQPDWVCRAGQCLATEDGCRDDDDCDADQTCDVESGDCVSDPIDEGENGGGGSVAGAATVSSNDAQQDAGCACAAWGRRNVAASGAWVAALAAQVMLRLTRSRRRRSSRREA